MCVIQADVTLFEPCFGLVGHHTRFLIEPDLAGLPIAEPTEHLFEAALDRLVLSFSRADSTRRLNTSTALRM